MRLCGDGRLWGRRQSGHAEGMDVAGRGLIGRGSHLRRGLARSVKRDLDLLDHASVDATAPGRAHEAPDRASGAGWLETGEAGLRQGVGLLAPPLQTFPTPPRCRPLSEEIAKSSEDAGAVSSSVGVSLSSMSV